jgi:hypothetical protein
MSVVAESRLQLIENARWLPGKFNTDSTVVQQLLHIFTHFALSLSRHHVIVECVIRHLARNKRARSAFRRIIIRLRNEKGRFSFVITKFIVVPRGMLVNEAKT